MHPCPIVCSVLFVLLFLLVIGTIVFASLSVTHGKSFLTGAIVTASLALVVLLSIFVYYTVTTYNDGNWLHYLVDKGTALQQKANEKFATAKVQLERAKADVEQLRAKLTAQGPSAQRNLEKAIEDAQSFVNEKQLQVLAAKAALPAPIASDIYQSLSVAQ